MRCCTVFPQACHIAPLTLIRPHETFYHFLFFLTVIFYSDDDATQGEDGSQDRRQETVESIHPSQEATILITGVYVYVCARACVVNVTRGSTALGPLDKLLSATAG